MKEYKATVDGIDHTFQLSDEDAKARGLDPAKDGKAIKESASPIAKAATPANKAADKPADK